MSDVSGGELKFENDLELVAWLTKQPRDASIVIAARAALRVLPLLHRLAARLEARQFAGSILASFWATALARVAAAYPTRAKELRDAALAAVLAANRVPDSAPRARAGEAVDAAFRAAFRAAAAAARAASVAAVFPPFSDTAACARAGESVDAAFRAADATDVWKAVSADANRLMADVPRAFASAPFADGNRAQAVEAAALASAPLWPQGAPKWVQENWRALQGALEEPHWKPWLDWYQRRLEGREAAEDIELLFATLPVDPRDKDPADQNAALAVEIKRLTRSRGSAVPGGELNFESKGDLEVWLRTQSRDVSVVIAARAALRVLPTLHRQVGQLEAQQFSQLVFASFWATALARVDALHLALSNELHAAVAAGSAFDAAEAALNSAASSAGAAAAAALSVAAAGAATASASAAVSAAAAFAPASNNGALSALAAFKEAAFDIEAAGDLWGAVSADANRLRTVTPRALASERLWLQGTPGGAEESWSRLRLALADPRWEPWRSWYARRLDGREAAEDIELLFATLPIDPREKDPAEQNAALAAEIERLRKPESSGVPSWDFFISYSKADYAEAREVVRVLETAGYSTFAQYKDIAPRHNFVREMQRGLEASRSLIAVVSPDYEASDHCQAEWALAYNGDPGGVRRKIIPFLARETKLNALASQVVYKNLVGLSGEARKQAILAAVAPKPLPKPAENVSAPFSFGWNAERRITIVSGPLNVPVFPHAGSDKDHRDRLDACRKTAARLAADLAARRFNARRAYGETLERYLEDLPAAAGEGNFLMADCEARTLRGLFEEDADHLPRELAERINRVLEFTIALRPYYEGVGRFYQDVKSGALATPLPRDAVEGFAAIVRAHSPKVFEPAVSEGLERVEEELPAERPPPPPPPEGVLAPRADPLEAPDPRKAHDYGVAGTVNAIYSTFLKGKDLAQAVKGWDDIAQNLGEHAGPVIEFLNKFLP